VTHLPLAVVRHVPAPHKTAVQQQKQTHLPTEKKKKFLSDARIHPVMKGLNNA